MLPAQEPQPPWGPPLGPHEARLPREASRSHTTSSANTHCTSVTHRALTPWPGQTSRGTPARCPCVYWPQGVSLGPSGGRSPVLTQAGPWDTLLKGAHWQWDISVLARVCRVRLHHLRWDSLLHHVTLPRWARPKQVLGPDSLDEPVDQRLRVSLHGDLSTKRSQADSPENGQEHISPKGSGHGSVGCPGGCLCEPLHKDRAWGNVQRAKEIAIALSALYGGNGGQPGGWWTVRPAERNAGREDSGG